MSRMCFNCMKMTEDGEFCAFCGKKLKTAPAHHLLPGTILNGKYTVGYALGEGGFGVTYIGLDNSLQIKVAIKEFFPKGIVGRNSAITSDVSCLNAGESDKLFDTEKAKVINEARILAKFSKERGIINVREYFEANNTAYIVMEYLEGETLEEYLTHSGPISADEAYALLHPVMKVLEQLHNEGVVHRDISPDNLMFDGEQIKLLDFGAAREVLYSTSKSFSVILKHGYAPEEQYRRKGHQGAWTDVYSLCATMYYCITNVIPDTSLDRMHEDELKRPSDLGVSISKQQEDALMRGLSVLPEDRLQSVAEFVSVWNGGFVAMPNPQKETVAAYKDIQSSAENNKKINTSGAETVYGGQAAFVSVDADERKVSGYYPSVDKPILNASKPKTKGLVFAIVGGVIVLLIAVVLILFWGGNNNTDKQSGTSNTQITELEDKYQQHLDKAEELLSEKKYDEAIAELETAEQLYGAHSNVTAKKKEIRKAKGLNDLATSETEENYKEAIEYIDKNLSEFKTDSDILGKRNLYVSKYKTQVITNADSALKSEGYEKAVSIINDGLKVLPDDAELTKKYDEYMEYAPVPLGNFTVVTGDVDQESEVEYDLLGNSYAPPNLFSVNHGWGSAGDSVVYLRETYSKLTGTIAKGQSDPFGRTTHTITIYGSKDGDWNNAEAIFHTWMKDTTEPVEFEIDLEDYKYLHIEVSDGGFFYLSNFEFWK